MTLPRKALAGAVVTVALLVAPAAASAHYPSWGDTHYHARIWAQNKCGAGATWFCIGNLTVTVGGYSGYHSRMAYPSWEERNIWGTRRWCNASIRVQQDGGPYVAQVYDYGCT